MAGRLLYAADPWVVALAEARGLTVVTMEEGGTANRPKIPHVCAHFRVPCIPVVDLIRKERSLMTNAANP
jgi:hypothetical protein